ncbi:DUF7504 family protein [Natronocalculus amylovorans]|uniref:Uncharacterized protein n=1 Tax=Natronocalculus amylovorans TaxID=2917812 RepID=A0AAE3FU74_9EURY|nr:hypothetical protein [Natronocalculus amylovorans]MCL9815722.1 hypothetical protein [Natronocalculus amylovorans]
MRPDGSDRQSAESRAVGLITELDNLKRTGSNLLIVGKSRHTAHPKACTSLLGSDDAGPRHRLFVTIDPTTIVENRLKYTASERVDSSLGVIKYTQLARGSAVTSAQEQSLTRPSKREAYAEDIGAVGIELSEQIAQIEAAHGRLAPAALRVCIDSVIPLFESYDQEIVFRFLRLVTDRIRSVHGMGHVHIQTDRDARYVKLIEPLFDAVIELKQENGSVYQQWDLRESGLSTDWLEVSE